MQIAENKKRREEEKRIDEVFINQLKHADEIAVALAEKDRKVFLVLISCVLKPKTNLKSDVSLHCHISSSPLRVQ